jgi:cytochrome c-type biogenesis protein CcmH/NrfG
VSRLDQDVALLEEADDDIVSTHRPASGTAPARAWGKPWIVGAVVVGIVVGVWMTGRGATSVDQLDPGAADAQPSAVAPEQSEADAAARQAELSARLAQDPADVEAHLELGVVLFNTGDLAGAKQQWTTVTDLDPSSAMAWYDLGFYYLMQSPPDYAGAEAVWRRVVELDPQSDLAMTAQSHLAGLVPSPDASPTPPPDSTAEPSPTPGLTPSPSPTPTQEQ